MKKIVLGSFLIVVSLCAAAAVGVGVKNISTIILDDSGNIIIEIEGDVVSTNCGGKNRFVLDNQSVHLNRMYAGLLAAQKTRHQVNLYYDGACLTIGGVEYPKITAIYFYQN